MSILPGYNWPIKRIKDIGTLRLGKMLSSKAEEGTELKPYLKSKNIGWLSLNLDSVEDMYFFPEEMQRLRLHKGDLLFSEGGEVGKTAIWEGEIDECYIQNSVHKLTLSKDNNPRYFMYLSYLLGQTGYYRAIVNLVSIMHLTYEKLRRVEVPVPPRDVQDRIAKYLDKQIKSINERICLRERELQALIKLKQSEINSVVTRGLNPAVPMKDSGIDWMGAIPAHWHIIRLKDVSYLYGGLTGKAGDDFRCDDVSQTKPFIPFTNILNNTIVDFSNFKQVVMSDGEDQNRVHENDILFLMSSEDYESIGKTAIVLGDPGEVYLNSFCRGLRFTNLKEVFPKFVNYLLFSDKYRDALRFEARGFTRINLKIDKIASLSIALPPMAEQKAIVEYLDGKYERIDAFIANINAQIDKLKLLKKALINEVVTGQRIIAK